MSEAPSILDSPEQLLGTQVLDFRLVEVLGLGGMSVVFKGCHTLTEQLVAVKVLPPELALHKELKLRFVEEAKVLARLDHPNIVTLNNFTVDQAGRLCLVMQYVEGVDFEKKIHDAGKLEAREAVRVCIEVTRALEYAHARGIVHRDMKPSNVLVRSDGSVKVTDFGIAKIIGGTRVTGTGQTMGTVRYMSPEQVRGLEVDARSDVYSLGITLYEALAGDTPFGGERHFEIMKLQVTEVPPSLRGRGVEISADLEDVVMCALEKPPASRFPDAASFRNALECVAEGARPGTARRPALPNVVGRRRRAQRTALGLSVLALGAAGIGGWLLLHPRPSPIGPPEIAAAEGPHPAAAPAWPPPHAVLRQFTLAVDERFPEGAVRILSMSPRDSRSLHERVLTARKLFPSFLAEESIHPDPSEMAARPLNLAIVPQSMMNRADLWPDFNLKAGTDYPSRYSAISATLYVADATGFERRDLPYGLALHFCAPMKRLSNEQCLDLAEKFERYFAAHAF